METNDAPIRIEADISGFEAAMADMSRSTEQFGASFARTMRQAVVSGRDLEDTLRALALRMSANALDRAFAPVEQAVGSLFGSLFSPPAMGGGGNGGAAATSVIFNVAAADAASFRKSENQISSMLARAVSRGQRNL